MPTGSRPEIDIVDSTWIGARPAALAAVVAEPANWRHWWPDLDLDVHEWRGAKGMRWTVRSARCRHGRGLSGSMEIWLEDVDDGVVAHYFLRLGSSAAPQLSRRQRERTIRAYRVRIKQVLWDVADDLDPARLHRVAAPRETADGTA